MNKQTENNGIILISTESGLFKKLKEVHLKQLKARNIKETELDNDPSYLIDYAIRYYIISNN